jgi:hypothetical protein
MEQRMAKDKEGVIVTDIKIPFWSMVVLMVKWSIAAIPAGIILFLIGLLVFTFFAGSLGGCAALTMLAK